MPGCNANFHSKKLVGISTEILKSLCAMVSRMGVWLEDQWGRKEFSLLPTIIWEGLIPVSAKSESCTDLFITFFRADEISFFVHLSAILPTTRIPGFIFQGRVHILHYLGYNNNNMAPKKMMVPLFQISSLMHLMANGANFKK